MKLYLLPALAALAAPLAVEGYSIGGGPRSLFSNPMVVYTPGAMLRRQRALANQIYRRPQSSPRYEITDNDEALQLAVDVPGIEAKDISVSVENDVLTLSGERKLDKDSYSFASKFSQSFSLDPIIEVDEISAQLKNGVLYVVAPKNPEKIEENVRRIPVMQVTDSPAGEASDDKVEGENDEVEMKVSLDDGTESSTAREEENVIDVE